MQIPNRRSRVQVHETSERKNEKQKIRRHRLGISSDNRLWCAADLLAQGPGGIPLALVGGIPLVIAVHGTVHDSVPEPTWHTILSHDNKGPLPPAKVGH